MNSFERLELYVILLLAVRELLQFNVTYMPIQKDYQGYMAFLHIHQSNSFGHLAV